MNTVDHAQDREAAHLADSLEKHARAARLDLPGNETCSDCGEAIPEERRRALPSAHRCVSCQAWAERVAKIRSIS